MKYTKYNYKKRRNNSILKFVASLLVGVVSACVIGLGVAWIILKVLPLNDILPSGNEISDAIEGTDLTNGEGNNEENSTAVEDNENSEFYFIQCGYFSSEDNAKQVLSKIQSEGGAFINEESGKYRVFAGAYSKDSVESELKDLTDRGIDSVKITFTLSDKDEVEAQVSAICDGYLQILTTSSANVVVNIWRYPSQIADGYLQILTTTFADDVKAVKTQEFKDWVNTLEDISSGNNLEVLQGLKTYINNLPDEISKENVANEMDYLYNLLLTFK